MANDKNYFEVLNSVDVGGKIEKKNGLSYLSWAWAWGELKKRFPDATYTIYENDRGWNYHTDNMTCWVKTGVTVNGIEHIEYLPVMDYKNRSISLEAVTSFDVNKAIQRSLTKAVARHGLGLYIYAGEDLPEAIEGNSEPSEAMAKPETKKKAAKKAPESDPRSELREFINLNGLDAGEIVAICGLNNKSTAEDYENALEYAKSLIG